MVSFYFREKTEFQRNARLFGLNARSNIEKISNRPACAPAIVLLPNSEFIHRADENMDRLEVPTDESTLRSNEKSTFNYTCLSPSD